MCSDQKLKILHKHDSFEVIWCFTQWKPLEDKMNDDITRRWGKGRWAFMWIVIKQISNKIGNTSVNKYILGTSCIKCLPKSKCNGIQIKKWREWKHCWCKWQIAKRCCSKRRWTCELWKNKPMTTLMMLVQMKS